MPHSNYYGRKLSSHFHQEQISTMDVANRGYGAVAPQQYWVEITVLLLHFQLESRAVVMTTET